MLKILGVLAVAVGGTTVAAPLPDAVPVEVFAAAPTVAGAVLSPNGTKIAAKVAVAGKQTLMVMSLSGGAKPAVFPHGDNDVNWWRWVNDEWLVVGLGTTEFLFGEDLYITRIAGVSADMSKINRIDWQNSGMDADDLIWSARDGSTRVVFAKQTGFMKQEDWYPSVWEADVSTGKAKSVIGPRANVWAWDTDGTGTLRAGQGYEPTSRKNFVIYRPSRSDPFTRMAAGTGLFEFSLPLPSVFRADGSAVAMHETGDTTAVYELALPSFTAGKKLFEVPGYDVDGIFLNSAQNDIDGVSYTDQRARVKWFNPALGQLQSELDQSVGVGNARIVSLSGDRAKLLVEIGDPSQAGGLYYWDTSQAKMQRIGWNYEKLGARKLSQVSTFRYASRDGKQIEAVLTLPRGRPAKDLPLIVMPHGGPQARDSEQFDWWTQFLAEQGYAVVQPNYRGSSGYGKAFLNLAKGEWGLKMQDDLVDAISALAAKGVADSKRVCIVGASYGGYAAMRAAERDRAHYRCAVSFAGVSDLGAMQRYDRQFLLGREAAAYWGKQAPDFRTVSPRFNAGQFGAPILIAHGVKDKRVPVRQSRLLADELKKRSKPFEYLEQPEGDHHFSRTEDRLEFLKALKQFLDKHNPA